MSAYVSSSTRSRHRQSEPSLTPGERQQRRIEAQRFFLTSSTADWLAKHRTPTRRPLRQPAAHAVV